MIRGIVRSKGFNSDDDTFCLSDNEIGLSSANGLNIDTLSRVSLAQSYPYQFKNNITSPVNGNGLNSTISQQQIISVDYDDICTESEVLSVASTSARVRKPRKVKSNQGSGQVNKNGDLPVSLNGTVGSRLANSNWINLIFEQAKSGNLPLLKQNLQGITTCLISNLCDEKGNTLWHVTARHNHMPCLRWLCFLPDGQEPLLIRNYQNLLPVESAIKNGSFDVVQWLIKATVVNKMVLESEPGERTLLHFTAKCGQEEILDWLVGFMIFNGVDINQRDMQGNTALHFAAKFNQTSSFKNLVMNNGDLKARNKMRLRPIDIAKMNGYKDCVNYLAALEACLSLAEENIALETELLHYGAEFTELEKCFSELLQLSKSDKVQMQGYFGSVVESIERKWKRCKAKSIGIPGAAKQSPLSIFQSHFSRVLTNGVGSAGSVGAGLGLSSNKRPLKTSNQQTIGMNRSTRGDNILIHDQFSFNETIHSHHHNNQFAQHRLFANQFNGTTASSAINHHLTNTGIIATDNNGYTHTYSDPYVKLNNASHYSVSSIDADYAVPCKTRTSGKVKKMIDDPSSQVNGRRDLKQRGQPEGSSITSNYTKSSGIYESYKHPRSVREAANSRDFDDDDDDDDDELSGYSSLKLRPPTQTSSSGSKDSERPLDRVDGSPSTDHSHQTKSPETISDEQGSNKVDEEADDESESKSSPSRSSLGSKESRGSIGATTELSEVESKISDGRESSMNGSVSMKENDSGVGEMDSNSGSRKRGFLHKFSLRKWTSSSPSKPKKSYSKETLLRSNETTTTTTTATTNGEATELIVSPKSSSSSSSNIETSAHKGENGDWWPDGGHSSHEINGKDDNNSHDNSSEPLTRVTQSDKQSSSSCSPCLSSNDNSFVTNSTSIANSKGVETCQIDPCSSKHNSSAGKSANNCFKSYENKDNPIEQKLPGKNNDELLTKPSVSLAKLVYCQLKDSKIRSASMEVLQLEPEIEKYYTVDANVIHSMPIVSNDIHNKKSANNNNHNHNKNNHVSMTADSISALHETQSTDNIIESLTSPALNGDSNGDLGLQINDHTPHNQSSSLSSTTQPMATSSSSLIYSEPPVTLTSAQSVPILSNSVYGVKHVKKAKIKELSPLTYDEPVSPVLPSPPTTLMTSSSISTPSSPKFLESRKKIFEKGPGTRNTRGLRRRRNGNRAWYDVSDDEDGLVPQKFDKEVVSTETQQTEPPE